VYKVALSGVPKGYATLVAGGVPALRSAPPKDFDGPGDAWSPEHLLLASVETCFMFTFQAVAQASKFDFLSLELSGSATVDRQDGTIRFTDISLRSRLTVPKGTDLERARRMLEKGKSACLVTASLSVPVHLNIAARVRELARDGSILMSQDSMARVADDFVFEDLGQHALKNVTKPIRIHRLVETKADGMTRCDVASFPKK
jgi:organic hydroperoxide reductase OsmC/OhrA